MRKRRKRRKKRIGRKIFFCILLLFAIILVDSNLRIETTEYELTYEELPQEFQGYRIAVLSDLHENDRWQENGKLIKAVADAGPDIIAITGDLIDEPGHEDYVRDLTTKLMSIAPVYYVTGNHEWASDAIEELFEVLDDTGVTVLRNEYVKLSQNGKSIILAGIDDPNGPYDMKTPKELVDEIHRVEGNNKFIALMAHRNDKTEVYEELDVSLIMCGHGHGGIIRLPFTDGLISTSREWFPSYTSGVYEVGDTTLLVSRGLGNIYGIPRILNNPHIPIAVLNCGA